MSTTLKISKRKYYPQKYTKTTTLFNEKRTTLKNVSLFFQLRDFLPRALYVGFSRYTKKQAG